MLDNEKVDNHQMLFPILNIVKFKNEGDNWFEILPGKHIVYVQFYEKKSSSEGKIIQETSEPIKFEFFAEAGKEYCLVDKYTNKHKKHLNKYENVWHPILLPQGLIKEYYPNGKIKRQTKYNIGHIEGDLIEYYEDGNIRIIWKYLHGQLNGESSFYDEKNILIRKNFYKKGSIERKEFYDKDNKKYKVEYYKNCKICREENK